MKAALTLSLVLLATSSSAGPLLASALQRVDAVSVPGWCYVPDGTGGFVLDVDGACYAAGTGARNRSWTAAQVAFVVAGVADAGSTHWALKQPGTRESNPLAPDSTAGMYAFKAAGTAGMLIVSRWLYTRSPRVAETVLWAFTGLWGSVAVNNVRLGAGN